MFSVRWVIRFLAFDDVIYLLPEYFVTIFIVRNFFLLRYSSRPGQGRGSLAPACPPDWRPLDLEEARSMSALDPGVAAVLRSPPMPAAVQHRVGPTDASPAPLSSSSAPSSTPRPTTGTRTASSAGPSPSAGAPLSSAGAPAPASRPTLLVRSHRQRVLFVSHLESKNRTTR